MSTEPILAKDNILDCGERLIANKGFVGVGLAEILTVAGVPKGSFYHYFNSKERFGEVLLTRYVDGYLERLDGLFKPDGRTARERLMTYWSYWNMSQCDSAKGDCSGAQASSKCLIVKLSAEVADISESMRLILRDGTDRVVRRIAQCIEEAVADESVSPSLKAETMALTLYELWLGASLLAKLRSDASPFEHALISTEQLLGLPAG